MIKKHVVTWSVILTLLIVATVFAYQLPPAEKSVVKVVNRTPVKSPQIEEVPQAIKVVKVEAPKTKKVLMNFAKVTLPQGDKKAAAKMIKALNTFSYARVQTHRLHRKAAEWFPIIEPILKSYGIPEDFKYMPLVESGLQGGESPKGAAGFWQFMPGTARSYGLKVNDKVDERNNLRKSTIAACKYIKELHGIFGNWALVAAAYNVGDGHMRKQMDRQNQSNYFKMKLNRETGAYVYKLISMKQIIKNPVRYGYSARKELLALNKE
ncbi:lytic transglycosylase domain-containing protein [Pedobacter sp.]|uniref:lytic transglycosylase domain-containing protein n=1 Tax=Pedobacter sp. TaxID=1411316 RepID=UPI003D7F8757